MINDPDSFTDILVDVVRKMYSMEKAMGNYPEFLVLGSFQRAVFESWLIKNGMYGYKYLIIADYPDDEFYVDVVEELPVGAELTLKKRYDD